MCRRQEAGNEIGRYKARKLMGYMNVINKRPDSHDYKKAALERPDIPNVLERSAPSEVWRGAITYLWTQGRWHYVAAAIGLFTLSVMD